MTEKVDGVFRTRSLGVGATGIPDQYADGKAAKVWNKYIGDQSKRTRFYREKLLHLLKLHEIKSVFDVACGTGVDSILLLEEGYQVTSVDASDKMLKHALKTRWARRKEPAFDNWVIEEGNWLHLSKSEIDFPENGFDCVLCIGNSFAHLPDFEGGSKTHIQALTNFRDALRPGGILVIDHRNYDHIVTGKKPPMKNIYYAACIKSNSEEPVDVKTSVLIVDGNYQMVTLDYVIKKEDNPNYDNDSEETSGLQKKFRLSYYPHLLKNFSGLLETVFGKEAQHTILADYEPFENVDNPAYYIHVIKKL
eukprot:gene20529-22548_t